MERVMIIGSPGAGKSTLAAELARRTGLPVIHLDQHHWRPGWVEPERAIWEAEVTALAERPRWIMDGNYGGSLALRIPRADTIIDLAFPLWLCLLRIVRRWLRHRGIVRSDMAEGCPEQLPFEFLAYTVAFPRQGRRRIERALQGYRGRLVRLRGPSEVKRFLAGLE